MSVSVESLSVNRLIIVGAGAHARKLWHYATLLNLQVRAFVDDDPQAISPSLDIPCISVTDASNFGRGQFFIVAIGHPVVRKRLLQSFEEKEWQAITLIHPTAYVAPDAHISVGVVICAHAIVETGSFIGTGTIIDVGTIVDHDCTIGDYCHLKPGSVIFPRSEVASFA